MPDKGGNKEEHIPQARVVAVAGGVERIHWYCLLLAVNLRDVSHTSL
jgi:hypothetical protein